MTHVLLRSLALTALAAGLSLSAPVQAQDGNDGMAGKVQLKLFGTAVLPDGKLTQVKTDLIGLPAGTQTAADDRIVPTIAAEYFVTDTISIETICCVTKHRVTGRGALAGAGLVANAHIIPATVTAKLHVPLGGAVRPYIGAGPTYFLFLGEKPGAATVALGATRQKMNDKVGAALQAGVDVSLGDGGLGLSIDAKRYFLRTDASWFAGNTLVLQTRHRLDPWVISAGLTKAF